MAQPEAPGYYSGYGEPPQPPEQKRQVGLIVAAIVSVVVLIMIAAGVAAAVYVSNRGSSEDRVVADPTSSSPAATDTGETTTDSTAPTSGNGVIGKPVRQGDLLITVTGKPRCGVQSIGSGYSAQENQKGQYCLIDLKFENTGAKAVKPTDFGTKLVDENGGETSVDWGSYRANPDNQLPLFENIYPKKTATGVIAFDLPKDQTPATLLMNPVGDYDDEIKISLK
ncbi:DUF4352 domain-containing protein [Cryptosporangium aurantiacum]|uniref:DUF4352 domain-containing protein n=1 Tax=Cryptosporangium aurantiacum TaxID=134849 RepID=A0A1M7RHH2_9ACTN|nr:DUF4352 domain-containing protein [Cryptosporangium aurantiacum]SHN45670.1 protein of unknown function [Cryptosporangium aurantiacum]